MYVCEGELFALDVFVDGVTALCGVLLSEQVDGKFFEFFLHMCADFVHVILYFGLAGLFDIHFRVEYVRTVCHRFVSVVYFA